MDNIKKRKVYHCKTYDDARTFIEKCKEQGFTWKNGNEIDGNIFWDKYKAKTCYKTNLGKISVTNIDDIDGRDVLVYSSMGALSASNIVNRKIDFVWLIGLLSKKGFKPKNKNGDIIDIALASIFSPDMFDLQVFSDGCVVCSTADKGVFLATKDYADKHKIEYGTYEKNDYVGEIVKIRSIGGLYAIESIGDDGRFNVVDETGSTLTTSINDIIPQDKKCNTVDMKKGSIWCEDYTKYFITEDSNGFFFTCKFSSPLSDSIAGENSTNRKIPAIRSFTRVEQSATDICVDEVFRTKDGDNIFKVIEKYDDFVLCTTISGRYCSVGSTYAITNDYVGIVIDETNIYEPPTPTGETIIESGDVRDGLINDISEVLEERGYSDWSYDAIGKIVDKWSVEKFNLAKLFRKHPSWDEDNLCIKIETTETNDINAGNIKNILATLYGNIQYYADSVKYKSLAMQCIQSIKYRITDNCVNNSIKTIIKDCFEVAGLRISCNEGMKIHKLVRDILTKCEIKYSTLERDYAKLADACSITQRDVIYTISINPIDFLHMSNGVSWSSCHYIESGNGDKCYQAGTISYALDGCSFIFSKIYKADVDGQKLAIVPKVNRQVFMYSDIAILQSRLYPDCNKTDYSKKIWGIVKKAIDECKGQEINYKDIGNENLRSLFVTYKNSAQYPDYEYSYYNIIVHKTDDADKYAIINPTKIGRPSICVSCGKTKTTGFRSDLRCQTCYDNYYDEEDC
jgi:hypothetical protein